MTVDLIPLRGRHQPVARVLHLGTPRPDPILNYTLTTIITTITITIHGRFLIAMGRRRYPTNFAILLRVWLNRPLQWRQ